MFNKIIDENEDEILGLTKKGNYDCLSRSRHKDFQNQDNFCIEVTTSFRVNNFRNI